MVMEVMFGMIEGEMKRGSRAENGWTTSRNGVEKKSTHSTGRRRIAAREGRWRRQHWTPTGAEPMEQWVKQ